MTRGLGIIRLSKTADPASTSIQRQRQHIEEFAASQGIDLAGFAIDEATSAFHVPPEKRKQIKEWLDKPSEYDCLIYWRQDRLVRRFADFIGLVSWCKANGKALYSATEGTGDVTESAGVLVGFIKAWQSEGESQSTSDRVKDSQAELAKQGRWRGGRVPYGAIARKRKDGPGYELVAGGPNLPRIREIVGRVIEGQSVNSINADFNRRGIPANDGGHWQGRALWKMLRNPQLLDLGIVDAADWSRLQTALNIRADNRTVRTTPESSPCLDIAFCGMCGGKIYRWKETKRGLYYGRCKNEMHRADAVKPCRMPRIPYADLEKLISGEIMLHKDEPAKEPITDATIELRKAQIGKLLLALMPEFLAQQIDHAEMMARQDALIREQRELEHANASEWRETGETVGQKWERLSPAERRLWLLRVGTTFTVHHEERRHAGRRQRRWIVRTSWRPVDDAAYRERVVRAV